jgi:hypothetical protein
MVTDSAKSTMTEKGYPSFGHPMPCRTRTRLAEPSRTRPSLVQPDHAPSCLVRLLNALHRKTAIARA